MVALLLFSALGIAIWSALAGGQNLVLRSIRLSAGTSRLLQMELYLRRTAASCDPFLAPSRAEKAACLAGRAAEEPCTWTGRGACSAHAPGEPGAVFVPSPGCGVSGGPGLPQA
jgi:hypothetical protein